MADKFLAKYGESSKLLNDVTWPAQEGKPDIVAKAVLDWALANGRGLHSLTSELNLTTFGTHRSR